MWSTGIHVVDTIAAIGGRIVDFDARPISHAELTSRWFAIGLEFGGGCAGSLELLPTVGMIDETYDIFGEGFRANVAAGVTTGSAMKCWRDGELVEEVLPEPDQPPFVANGAYNELCEFITALRDGRPPCPTIDDVLPGQEICFKIAEVL